MMKNILINQDPLVSLIIPIYNTEEYLRDCLNSCCEQSEEKIEIICVNDGSTDTSEDIITEFCNKDFRIKLIRQDNRGLSAARNEGFKHARGKYCYFLDSDDYIKPNTVEVLLKEMELGNLDILFFGGKAFCDVETERTKAIFEKEKRIWERKIVTDVLSGEELFTLFQMNKVFTSSVCVQIYRRDFLVKNCLTFAEGFLHEDLLYTYKAVLNAERVKCINNILFCRRLRPESIITESLTHKNFEGRFHTYIASIFESKRHSFQSEKTINAMVDFIKVSFNNSLYVYHKLDDNEKMKIFTNDMVYRIAYETIGYNLREL